MTLKQCIKSKEIKSLEHFQKKKTTKDARNYKYKLPKLKCNYCGYQWIPYVEHTKSCPSCKRYHWNSPRVKKCGYDQEKGEKMVKLPKLKCKRCGHQWTSRVEHNPKNCPHCHTYDWNSPRVRELGPFDLNEYRKKDGLLTLGID